MIIIKIIGGLGNQLFQYALGYALRKQNPTELKIDISQYVHFPDRRYELGHFGLKNFASEQEIAAFFPKNFFEKTFRKGKFRVLKEKFFHYDPEILRPYEGENVYVEGYWQSALYWEKYEAEIREIFRFRNVFEGKNAFFQEKIHETTAVALHIRRGDYVEKPNVIQHYYQCPLSYYEQSIKQIQEQVENPYFFIFSDDIVWCKQNIILKEPHFYVETGNNLMDLELMSLCQHQIMANSSFSWWGAWLNPNPKKIVITPPRWFNDPSIQTADLFPKSWGRN